MPDDPTQSCVYETDLYENTTSAPTGLDVTSLACVDEAELTIHPCGTSINVYNLSSAPTLVYINFNSSVRHLGSARACLTVTNLSSLPPVQVTKVLSISTIGVVSLSNLVGSHLTEGGSRVGVFCSLFGATRYLEGPPFVLSGSVWYPTRVVLILRGEGDCTIKLPCFARAWTTPSTPSTTNYASFSDRDLARPPFPDTDLYTYNVYSGSIFLRQEALTVSQAAAHAFECTKTGSTQSSRPSTRDSFLVPKIACATYGGLAGPPTSAPSDADCATYVSCMDGLPVFSSDVPGVGVSRMLVQRPGYNVKLTVRPLTWLKRIYAPPANDSECRDGAGALSAYEYMYRFPEVASDEYCLRVKLGGVFLPFAPHVEVSYYCTIEDAIAGYLDFEVQVPSIADWSHEDVLDEYVTYWGAESMCPTRNNGGVKEYLRFLSSLGGVSTLTMGDSV